MPDTTVPPTETQTETDRLRTALAEARADLERRDAALAKLQGELVASRLEVSGARGETVQFEGFMRRAQAKEQVGSAHIVELRAAAAAREAEIGRLHAHIQDLATTIAVLRNEVAGLRASLSWRVSAPIRVAGRLLRRR